MNDVKRILVVSRMTESSQEVINYGVSIAKQYGAQLYVIHVIHNPFSLEGWNIPVPSPEKEYMQLIEKTKKNLNKIIDIEKKKGMSIKEIVKEGEPTKEILKVIKEEKIDLLIMLAHEESRFEHFLFGRSTDEIMRKLPCSILMVKREARPVEF
jgi:universal stress protein A